MNSELVYSIELILTLMVISFVICYSILVEFVKDLAFVVFLNCINILSTLLSFINLLNCERP